MQQTALTASPLYLFLSINRPVEKYIITLLNALIYATTPRSLHLPPKAGRSRTRSHPSPRRPPPQKKKRTAVAVDFLQALKTLCCRSHNYFGALSFHLRLCLVVLRAQVRERAGFLYPLMSARKESGRKSRRPAYRRMSYRRMRGGGRRNGHGTTSRNKLSDTA